MLAGGSCETDAIFFKNDLLSFSSKDDILACLIHLGYLAYDADAKKTYIPNKEITKVFEKAIKEI